jgi:hypothetical protein
VGEKARAIGKLSKVQLAHLKLPGGKAPRNRGLAALGGAVTRRTNISMRKSTVTLGPRSKKLFRLPLLVTTAAGALPKVGAKTITRLRRHLTRGGTWVLDGPSSASGAKAFRASAARVARQLFPKHKLRSLPASHTLFKSFYLLTPSRFSSASLPVSAVVRDGRAVLIVVQGVTAAGQGGVVGRLREWLYRLGVNLVMYALCVDYKSDQVHAPAILRRRKWRAP